AAEKTGKDGIVRTRFSGGVKETSHPSYQAWTYSELLKQFNETVDTENIGLVPCAYLYRYQHEEADGIRHPFYQAYLEKAPTFLQGRLEKERLQAFIKKFVKYGDQSNLMVRIENGKIRPSKSLVDSLSRMLDGNPEFLMIDEQKLAFETALELARNTDESNASKQVLIVEGGPGTGKSVVAVNLLVELMRKQGKIAQYVTKNAAPRAVFHARLTGQMTRDAISNLFNGAGAFHNAAPDSFDALIVDEAHRLNEKSGMFKHLGENQVKELIHAARLSVFFIDEDQKVTWGDIGSRKEIEKWAHQAGAKTHHLELASQFRCNGSDGYLAWLDHVLGIRETANPDLSGLDYDFQVFSDPNALRETIVKRNQARNRARLVAGYCWNWVSKKNPQAFDVVIPEHGFQMQWNLTEDGSLWIQAENSVNQIGCIHTCQGLEVDTIGVIIGDDLVIRNGEVVTNPAARAKTDKSLAGYKTMLKSHPNTARQKADQIIKNTYRTLMTRGMKGCYIYCTDPETQAYFQAFVKA
ncbi:MAG: DUF2075 domain-containing protein, partial [Betaproteobacteria bacterium]|nr:DUF2075 domain-containing protein [Betaproteobacteria bacterium]